MGKLREAMRPEFINRIDEIVLFRKLDRSQIASIVSLLLQDTALRLVAQDMVLSVSDAGGRLARRARVRARVRRPSAPPAHPARGRRPHRDARGRRRRDRRGHRADRRRGRRADGGRGGTRGAVAAVRPRGPGTDQVPGLRRAPDRRRARRRRAPCVLRHTVRGCPHRARLRSRTERAGCHRPADDARCSREALLRCTTGTRHAACSSTRVHQPRTVISLFGNAIPDLFRKRGCALNCGADSVHSSRTVEHSTRTTPPARDRKGADHDDHNDHSVPWNPWTRRYPVPRPLTRSVPLS